MAVMDRENMYWMGNYFNSMGWLDSIALQLDNYSACVYDRSVLLLLTRSEPHPTSTLVHVPLWLSSHQYTSLSRTALIG
jgi:hypothetical protein